MHRDTSGYRSQLRLDFLAAADDIYMPANGLHLDLRRECFRRNSTAHRLQFLFSFDTLDVDPGAYGGDFDIAVLRNPHGDMTRCRPPAAALVLFRFYLYDYSVALALEDELLDLVAECARHLDRIPRPSLDGHRTGRVVDFYVAIGTRIERFVDLFGTDRRCKHQPGAH